MKETTAELENIKASTVLSILRNSHARQCLYDPEADPDISLSMTSTVREWREACDLVPWKPLGNAMNEIYSIYHTTNEWRDVLEPAKTKTLQGVCELIAQTATRAKITPFSIGGTKSEEVGVYIAITTTLRQYDCDIHLRPSSPLTEDNVNLITEALGMIAPDIFIPPVIYEYPNAVSTLQKIFMISNMLLCFCGFAFIFLNIFLNTEIGLVTLMILPLSSFITSYLVNLVPPSRLHIDEQETVGDVCRLVVKMRNQNNRASPLQ